MSTYGTRLGIVKQVLGLGYKDLVEKLDHVVTDRSLRNYIDNKTQMPGNIITQILEIFPQVNPIWWHSGEGQILITPPKPYTQKKLEGYAKEPDELYNAAKEGETVTIPASELFMALFKDMTEVNKLLQSRLEYYEVFIKNIDKYKI